MLVGKFDDTLEEYEEKAKSATGRQVAEINAQVLRSAGRQVYWSGEEFNYLGDEGAIISSDRLLDAEVEPS